MSTFRDQASSSDPLHRKLRFFRRLMTMVILGWSLALSASLAWNLHQLHQQSDELARNEARSNFNKDQAFRLWGTRHGGVYVQADETTPPNPYLAGVPERDVVTSSGKTLTLMNPAFMVRQMMEMYGDLYGIRGHITSLNPLNPHNVADPWESQALGEFEKGSREAFGVSDIDGRPYLRLMRPMVTQEGCLKCHAAQGYKVGDIRGGVGVSVPLEPYRRMERENILAQSGTHLALWLLGLGGITVAGRRQRKVILSEAADEQAFRQLSRQNELILGAVEQGICGLDPEGRITFLNTAGAAALGRQAEQVLGMTLHDLIHAPAHEPCPFENGGCPLLAEIRQGSPNDGPRDETFWRPDGSSFAVEYRLAPLSEGPDLKGAVLVFRDVTQQRNREKELVDSAARLQASNADLEQFAYVASHDLREPLRMISSYISLLERRYGEQLDSDAHDFIGFARDGAKRMDRLIMDLLEYSRVGRKTQPFQQVSTDLAAGIAVAHLGPAIQQSGAKVELGRLPEVWGDEEQLVSLFQNLIGNAIKYQPPGQPPVVRVQARAQDGKYWAFDISDNGIGIPPEQSGRIFMIFQRLHGREEYEGSGIGLSICKRIVERHGGTISVQSSGLPGDGSTFTFTLPANPPTTA